MVYDKVIVVCHGILIHSVSGGKWLENAEIYEYNYRRNV